MRVYAPVCVYKYYSRSVCPHGISPNIVLLHKIDISSFIGFICSHFFFSSIHFVRFFSTLLIRYFSPSSLIFIFTSHKSNVEKNGKHSHLNRQRFQNNKENESVLVNVSLYLCTINGSACVYVRVCVCMHV